MVGPFLFLDWENIFTALLVLFRLPFGFFSFIIQLAKYYAVIQPLVALIPTLISFYRRGLVPLVGLGGGG